MTGRVVQVAVLITLGVAAALMLLTGSARTSTEQLDCSGSRYNEGYAESSSALYTSDMRGAPDPLTAVRGYTQANTPTTLGRLSVVHEGDGMATVEHVVDGKLVATYHVTKMPNGWLMPGVDECALKSR